MPAARLYTVRVTKRTIQHVGRNFEGITVYECDFAGIHFSRQNCNDLTHWVRIAAKNRYGKTTQVIFLHEEKGLDQ